MRMRWGALAAIGLLAGCSSEATAPDGWRQPGVLLITGWTGTVPTYLSNGEGVQWNRPTGPEDFSAPEVITAPDTVDAGVAFEVATHTVGPSGCWRSDGQSVTIFGRTVLLRPYDSHSGSEVCTGALVFPVHRSTVQLYETGEWTLRVEGRRLRMGDDAWDEPISAQRSIVVR